MNTLRRRAADDALIGAGRFGCDVGPATGPHLVIHDGTKLAVAVLKPAAAAVSATFTDTRAWIGVKATDVGASLGGSTG